MEKIYTFEILAMTPCMLQYTLLYDKPDISHAKNNCNGHGSTMINIEFHLLLLLLCIKQSPLEHSWITFENVIDSRYSITTLNLIASANITGESRM